MNAQQGLKLAREALAELADIVQGVLDEGNTMDSFTLQPARHALAVTANIEQPEVASEIDTINAMNKAWLEYQGTKQLTMSDAFLFAAGFKAANAHCAQQVAAAEVKVDAEIAKRLVIALKEVRIEHKSECDDLRAQLATCSLHVAYAENGILHWMTGRKFQNCELYTATQPIAQPSSELFPNGPSEYHRGWAVGYKQGIGAQQAVAAPDTTAEQVQWCNIQHAVREVAKFCFSIDGKVVPEYETAYMAITTALTAKDGVQIKLAPLPRHAMAAQDRNAALEEAAVLVLQYTGIPSEARKRGTGVRDVIVILGEELSAAIRALNTKPSKD